MRTKPYNDGTGDVIGMPPVIDRSPTKFSAGDTIVGFGLHNAGRYCTVLEVSKTTRGRLRINRHLDDKTLWTFDTWYRLAD
jgi:hypothetical protein